MRPHIYGDFCPEARSVKIVLLNPKWCVVGPCTRRRHHEQRSDSTTSIWVWILLFFWRFYWSNFYAQILKVCAQRICFTQTDAFTHFWLLPKDVLPAHIIFFYIPMLCTKRTLFTPKKMHAGAPTHRTSQNHVHSEAFAQNNFYTKKLLHRKTLAHKNLHTDCTKICF